MIGDADGNGKVVGLDGGGGRGRTNGEAGEGWDPFSQDTVSVGTAIAAAGNEAGKAEACEWSIS